MVGLRSWLMSSWMRLCDVRAVSGVSAARSVDVYVSLSSVVVLPGGAPDALVG